MKIDFPAILLAGGFGTRLRSAVPDLPKPLAPVQGRPFITYLLDQLVDAGWTRAIICLHYHAEKMIETLGPRYRSLELEYSVETDPVGTGGAFRLALTKVDAPRYLVMNADSYCHVALGDFVAFHLAHGCPASLVSINVEDTARYGALKLAADGRIVALAEKNGTHQPGPINGGIYLVENAPAKSIPEGRPVSLEREIFPLWLEKGFMAWRTSAAFIDIGVPESFTQAQSMGIFAKL
jgi:D-glycero-alpha-D-manno-heptose 1-phosphate guanylyltransferase